MKLKTKSVRYSETEKSKDFAVTLYKVGLFSLIEFSRHNYTRPEAFNHHKTFAREWATRQRRSSLRSRAKTYITRIRTLRYIISFPFYLRLDSLMCRFQMSCHVLEIVEIATRRFLLLGEWQTIVSKTSVTSSVSQSYDQILVSLFIQLYRLLNCIYDYTRCVRSVSSDGVWLWDAQVVYGIIAF